MSFYFLCCLTIESKTAYLSNFICFIDIKTAIEFVYRTWLNFILYCCAALSPFYHEVKHYIVAKCIKNHKKLCNSQTHLMVNKITMINTPFLLFIFYHESAFLRTLVSFCWCKRFALTLCRLRLFSSSMLLFYQFNLA